MAIIVTGGDPNDGALVSQSFLHEGGNNANGDFENDARNGSNVALDPGQDPISGQRLAIGGQKWNNGSQTSRYESFLAFRTNQGFLPPSDIGDIELVNVAVRVSSSGIQNDSSNPLTEALVYYERPWDSVTTSSWVDLMPLLTNPQLFDIGGWGYDRVSYNLYETASQELYSSVLTHLQNGTDLEFMATLLSAINTYPTSASYLRWIVSANHMQVAAKYRPAIICRYQRRHALNHVLGASIQLTDGTAVFLRYDDTLERVSLYYQRVGQFAPTLIEHLRTKTPTHDHSQGAAQYWGIEPGAQTFGITRDASNNIYITGPRGNPQTTVEGQKVYNVGAYKYTGNGTTTHTWQQISQSTSGENSEANNFTHRGRPNNFAPVWVASNQGGPAGGLVAMHSRRDSHWSRFHLGASSDYAGWWLALSGATKRHFISYALPPDSQAYWRPWNPSGSGLDAFCIGNDIWYAGFIQALRNDEAERSAAGHMTVGADGSVGEVTFIPGTISVNSPHDPDAKVRCVWLGDSSNGYAVARHGHIQVVDKVSGSILRQVDLTASNVTGFPSRTDLQHSSAWDVIWDSGSPQWIWCYYRDANNFRKIRKVRWNYTTGALDTSFEFTAEPLGPSGSEIVALRLPRQQTDTRCILLDVALQDGGGAGLPLTTIRDTSMDVPPSPPVIQPIESFNAGGTKAIEWLFSDQNSQDYATYQDVEIRNVETGTTVHSVSHVTAAVVTPGTRYRYTIGASVLTNDSSYQIRIRAYDAVDVAGDFSQWVPFSTTATGGLVTIIEPAEDLLPLNRSSVTVKWTYSNSTPSVTQTGYRVRVFNDVTNAVISDTGVLNGTNTEYEITGLASDLQFRIEVIIRDSNNQLSGAGVRLVRPDYNNPSLPSIVAEPGKGYIEIRVTNPPPVGENPVTVLNQIARREIDQTEEEYVVIGECPPNGVFQDWSVAAGVEYVYKARGQS